MAEGLLTLEKQGHYVTTTVYAGKKTEFKKRKSFLHVKVKNNMFAFDNSVRAVIMIEQLKHIIEWDEFNRLDYRGNIVINVKRVLKAEEAFLCEGLCW